MSQLGQLVQQRANYEALKKALLTHGNTLMTCECWQYDLEGARRLQAMFDHMKLIAERMEFTLANIRSLEAAMLAP